MPPAKAARRLVAVNPTAMVGGAEIVLLRLLEAAREAGWSIDVVVPDGVLADRVRTDGSGTVGIPDLKLPAGPRVLALLRAGLRAARAARRITRAAHDADVVVANGVLTLAALR